MRENVDDCWCQLPYTRKKKINSKLRLSQASNDNNNVKSKQFFKKRQKRNRSTLVLPSRKEKKKNGKWEKCFTQIQVYWETELNFFFLFSFLLYKQYKKRKTKITSLVTKRHKKLKSRDAKEAKEKYISIAPELCMRIHSINSYLGGCGESSHGFLDFHSLRSHIMCVWLQQH